MARGVHPGGASGFLGVTGGAPPTVVFELLTNGAGAAVAVGEVVRISANGTFALARADVIATAQGVVGVAMDAIANGARGRVAVAGEATVLLDAALVVAAGNTIWVSTITNGRGTNVQPGPAQGLVDMRLGVVKDASGYAANNTVLADLVPDAQAVPGGTDNVWLTNGDGLALSQGHLVRTSSTANDTVLRVFADTDANCRAFIGAVVIGGANGALVPVRTQGIARALVEAGITRPAQGTMMFVSRTTRGRATWAGQTGFPTNVGEVMQELGPVVSQDGATDPIGANETVIVILTRTRRVVL